MKFFTIALALFSFSAFAIELNFKCDFTDLTTTNQFSLQATNVNVTEGKFTNAEFDFTLRKAGRVTQIERLTVTRDGSYEYFAPGTFSEKYPTMRLMSVQKGAEVEYISLIIDVPQLHASRIRFNDGMTYFGSCKSL